MRFKLQLAYDGTNYSGWQRQPNALTVQEEFEMALSKVLNKECKVMGCGRTDAGVHARFFVLHFDFEEEMHPQFVFRMNQLLPPSIAVFDVVKVADNFHARFDAKSRTYHYLMHFSKDPFLSERSAFLYKEPDLEQMNECASILLEYDDFASFCKSGAENKTSICKIEKAEWFKEGGVFRFEIKADRFLRNMVRAIVGTMIEVGIEKRKLEDFRAVIEAKDRRSSGKSAAACGLYLVDVAYE